MELALITQYVLWHNKQYFALLIYIWLHYDWFVRCILHTVCCPQLISEYLDRCAIQCVVCGWFLIGWTCVSYSMWLIAEWLDRCAIVCYLCFGFDCLGRCDKQSPPSIRLESEDNEICKSHWGNITVPTLIPASLYFLYWTMTLVHIILEQFWCPIR